MATYDPADAGFAERVRASFARQALMRTLGAELVRVAAGEVEIALPFREELTQQHGYLHAAAVTAIVDSACGYAAMTLTEADVGVLTVEYNVSFLRPARGVRMRAVGRVLRRGRALTVCAGDVHAETPAGEQHVATMLATISNARRAEVKRPP
jgi:uncharacterized protein (TIGR00369 family)